MMESPVTVSSKLPKLGESIFSHMSRLALQENALNLSQGFPDFAVDPTLIELVHQAMVNHHNQYAPSYGIPALREAIARKIGAAHGAAYDPDKEVLVTAGATQAINAAITALVREEDEVIILTPAYDCYQPAVELVGGRLNYVQLKHPDYRVDWDELKKLVNRKTRMIILNTPHNPTGAILEQDDLDQLARIVDGTDIVVLSDEVYEHIIFDGKPHLSMSGHPALVSRSVVVASFGKIFHNTGWKSGYCVAPQTLMTEIRKIHQFQVFSVNTPVQHALAEFLKLPERYRQLPDFFQAKRDRFVRHLAPSRFKIVPSGGTYFQLLDYSAISDMPDTEFAEYLCRTHKIASIPVSVFYHQPTDHQVLRFCFAKGDDTLDRAAEILNKL